MRARSSCIPAGATRGLSDARRRMRPHRRAGALPPRRCAKSDRRPPRRPITLPAAVAEHGSSVDLRGPSSARSRGALRRPTASPGTREVRGGGGVGGVRRRSPGWSGATQRAPRPSPHGNNRPPPRRERGGGFVQIGRSYPDSGPGLVGAGDRLHGSRRARQPAAASARRAGPMVAALDLPARSRKACVAHTAGGSG